MFSRANKLSRQNKHSHERDLDGQRALATGYALALVEHGLFLPCEKRDEGTDAGIEEDIQAAVLRFADWFASRPDQSLSRSYRHWCAHTGGFPPVSIPPQIPRSIDVAEGKPAR